MEYLEADGVVISEERHFAAEFFCSLRVVSKPLNNVFIGCWYKENHIFLWGWIEMIFIAAAIVFIIIGLCSIVGN